MNYAILGLSHKTAPVALRERFSLLPEAVPSFLRRVLGESAVTESAVLSTCNRFELYTVMKADAPWREVLRRLLFAGEHLPDDCLYECHDRRAVSHLFSVTASLDSMIVGENQITSQVKQAYQIATQEKTTGPYLNRLFHRALHVAKRVKTETGLGAGQVSVGSVAVQLAKKIFGDLSGKSLVLLGAGKVGELVWKHLADSCDPDKVFVVNRSRDRAEAMLAGSKIQVAVLEDLDDILLKADIMIASLAQGLPDKNEAYFRDLMQRRGHVPLFIIDLGVPRNILPEVARVHDVYLYNIDDLKEVARQNQGSRQDELLKARHIVTQETDLFFENYGDTVVLPTIASLKQKFEEIRQRELEKSLSRLGHLSPKDREAIDRLTSSIVNKALHDPILVLRNKKDLQDGGFLRVFKKIFHLDEDENEYQ